MARTRIIRRVAKDRISNLPGDIIDHILKYLPLRDAVRTSILSRGWRYKWITIPYLVFDRIFKESLHGNYNIEAIIYQILLLHKGSIVRFTLDVDDTEIIPSINHWLHFLSNHHIEELMLRPSTFRINYVISRHLFTFDHFRHLYLSKVEMSLPPAFKGFSKLLRLDLESVRIAPAELKKLISICPMLEDLNLHNLDCDTEELEIDAPYLKSFRFFGSFNSIWLKNASHLTNMSMICFNDEKLDYDMFEDYAIFDPYESDGNVIEALGQLSYLKSNGGFLQFLAGGGVPRKLPTNLNHLTDLCLPYFGFQCIAQVMCALCLIRSSPNLQSLEIISDAYPDADMESTTQHLKAQQKHESPLGRLKIVKICRFSGLGPEMEFVKLFLSAATALRKLEIGSNYAAETEEGSKMLKELVSFCRASPKAQIIFQDPPAIKMVPF